LTLAVTGAAVGMIVVATIAISALGLLQAMTPRQPGWLVIIERIGMNVALVAAAAAAAATLYRYGPSHQKARWIWITPGSVFTAIAWLILGLGLGPYVANVGHFDTTYGSLGTVVALLTWIYLSTYALLFGAQLNAEFERQTCRDTTTGRRSGH
jgi:membrane protein